MSLTVELNGRLGYDQRRLRLRLLNGDVHNLAGNKKILRIGECCLDLNGVAAFLNGGADIGDLAGRIIGITVRKGQFHLKLSAVIADQAGGPVLDQVLFAHVEADPDGIDAGDRSQRSGTGTHKIADVDI